MRTTWTWVAAAAALVASPIADARTVERSGSVFARVTSGEVALGNRLVERRWEREALRTAALVDRRSRDRTWSAGHRDFTLKLAGAEVGSEDFRAERVRVTRIAGGGLRVAMELAPRAGIPPGLTATRRAEAYPGIAGIRTQTVLRSAVPLALRAATLDEAAPGAARPTLHAFRAGADWREPDWPGPPIAVGDPHAGPWRETRSAPAGAELAGPGQWLSLGAGPRTLFMVIERAGLPSSRASYDGSLAALEVDYARDVLGLGPFEEQAHVENPTDGPGRARVIGPGAPLALEPAFTGFGKGGDDEPWQFHRYLVRPGGARYPRAVVFNSNGTDSNRISTGAKDDMDFRTIREVAPTARRLGVETFVLDDGWQAVSGDWEPDSPEHREPRAERDPERFAPRFPDAEFAAVREAIAPMRLGLWMTPLNFHPASRAYREHPEWACAPVGHATAALNAAQPDDGSNEAGIGVWGREALPHVERRIRRAIEAWGVTYFKFDFLVWLDCAGQGDLYDQREAFVAMLDRLRRDHPGVTFQIDETNDYRLFPFESTARGPTWFQNGTPGVSRLLHNLWNLSPYVPAFAIGQHVLGGEVWREQPVGTAMAAALLSHVTLFTDLRELPPRVVDEASRWLRFYKARRGLFAGVVYPLLRDPLEGGWTALQSWDPERGRGALLAFRQDSNRRARTIALRGVPSGRRFKLIRAPGGTLVGTATSAELSRGLRVELPRRRSALVLEIVPAPARR